MTYDPTKARVSESVRRLNPHLFLGAVEAAKPKPNLGSQGQDPKLEEVPECVGYRITFIVVGRRRLDEHENLRMACKVLADCATHSLGFKSDDDPRLEWSYAQTAGRRGDCAD